MAAIRVGVSACLLGQEVRFDGGHKHDRFATDVLGPFVEWVPVCPELEAGLGVPRPSMRLVRVGRDIRLLENGSGRDHTALMARFSKQRVRALRDEDLCGYLLKRDSPTCGMERVKIYSDAGMPQRDGRGMFAALLQDAYPKLPIEEEGRLNDPQLRENFIERLFAYRRLRDLFAGRPTRGRIVAFHTAHKLQLMAHSTERYRALGRLVAGAKGMTPAQLRGRYEAEFMDCLAVRATRARNTNVLQHAAGHLKKFLDPASRSELSLLIHEYRRGFVPIVVPITLLRHHIRVHDVEYLAGQSFLAPHPKELMLRNHV